MTSFLFLWVKIRCVLHTYTGLLELLITLTWGRLFKLSKSSKSCRFSVHFDHAYKHYDGILHKCKQPRLYNAMSLDMHMWFIIPIAILKGDKHMHNPLRKFEHNMIKSINPTLNIAGNPYKSKSKLRGNVIMAIFNYNLSNQRYDTSRNNKVQSINNINTSGILTRFWYGHEKVEDKLWFNLHVLLKI